LNGTECVQSCPMQTYPLSGVCKNCDSQCQTCISELECTTCNDPYYHIPNTYTCTLDCGSGFYADSNIRECLPCDSTCKTCSGPLNSDCITCDIQKGLIKYTNDPGFCLKAFCNDGYFSYLNITKNTIECLPCDKTCATCIEDSGPSFCLSCKSGLKAISVGDGTKKVYCKACEHLMFGLYTASDGSCKEICGDGINLGYVECDDGNLIDGDGCNSQCEIEDGYRCYRQENGPDECLDYIAPTALIMMKRPNGITIKFSESIVVNAHSDSLLEHINVWLEGTPNYCPISWKSKDYFYKGRVMNELNIELEIGCGLKGNAEIFFVNFTDPYLITDSSGNQLQNRILEVRSKRLLYISKSEKEVVVGTGATFDFSTMVTLALVVGASLLQSAAVESFWAFLNMVQLLSYVPVIMCDIPYNLEIFLTEYLSVSKVSFPFQLLPDWIPKPLYIMQEFITGPLNARFFIAGYETISFVYNFGDQLFTWIMIGLFYLLLKFLCCCIPRSKCETIHKMKKEYEYNTIIRVLIECYLNMSFCAILNLWMVFLYILLINLF